MARRNLTGRSSPSGSEGLLFHRAPDFDPVSLSQHERDRAREQKAKDWDGLEKICKREPVETPKVHLGKLVHGCGAIYDEDILVVIVAVVALLDGCES